jgi:acetoin utilization deacetylase AcuC-like enzyme
VQAVRSKSASRGSLDGETVLSPGSYPGELHAAGGACAMVDALMSGEARAAFCAIRPPGHHARSDTTSGFCLFNNVAVAAQHALDARGARRVFIFDWDLHHGDGTNDIFRASDAALFASIHQARTFPGTGPLHDAGARAGEGFSINLPVPARSGEDAWISLLEHIAVPAALEFRPDLVLISPATTPTATTARDAASSRPAPSPRWPATCGRSARRWALRSASCWRAATR